MAGPQVSIDLGRIERNARTVVERCGGAGVSVYGVTKGVCGMPQVARAMLRGGVAGLAESRFENIRRLRDSGITAPIMLLRSPPLSRVEEVVRSVDVSLQSEVATIREISRIAARMGRVHDVLLMLDLGDLREGIWPSELVPTVEEVMALPGVRLAGVGTNLGCFGAIMPTVENLGRLVAAAYTVERMTGSPLDFVSGGASSSIALLLEGRLPAGINNLRVGEAILQGGIETFRDPPWTDLEYDACRLSADVIEVKLKPSRPIGRSGYDAFGNQPVFTDDGDRLRAIANVGREDVIVEGLTPLRAGVRVLGASSDHLLLDVTEAEPAVAVGDRIAFRMGYGAMLLAMTSEYVEKVPVHDVDEAGAGARMVQIVADALAGPVLARNDAGERLEAMGYDVVEPAELDRLPAGLTRLSAGATRRIALDAVAAATRATHSLGLIRFDSIAAMASGEAAQDERSVLAELLGAGDAQRFQPQVSPENVVLVGLREASPAEAAALKASRGRVFTMSDIDRRGMAEVIAEALRVAASGTRGIHVSYSPSVTDMPGWAAGAGGITVRETHLAMEAVAASGLLISMDIEGLGPTTDPQVAAETVSFAMSAFGKRIL